MVEKDHSAKGTGCLKAQVFGLPRLANRPLPFNFLGQVEDKRENLTCNHADRVQSGTGGERLKFLP